MIFLSYSETTYANLHSHNTLLLLLSAIGNKCEIDQQKAAIMLFLYNLLIIIFESQTLLLLFDMFWLDETLPENYDLSKICHLPLFLHQQFLTVFLPRRLYRSIFVIFSLKTRLERCSWFLYYLSIKTNV